MQAVRKHSYGGPKVLKYEEAPRPKPEAGKVLVRIHRAGVNPVDWKIREGYLKVRRPKEFQRRYTDERLLRNHLH